jgi:hypothetical protein
MKILKVMLVLFGGLIAFIMGLVFMMGANLSNPIDLIIFGSGSQRAFCFVVVVNEECEGGLMHAMAFGKRSGFSN